jgi:hypothetical protein
MSVFGECRRRTGTPARSAVAGRQGLHDGDQAKTLKNADGDGGFEVRQAPACRAASFCTTPSGLAAATAGAGVARLAVPEERKRLREGGVRRDHVRPRHARLLAADGRLPKR